MSSDTTASRSAPTNGGAAPGVEAAEHERQFRELLEFCPAALMIVDDDGRLMFHNARLRELLGCSKEELDGVDTSIFWHDREQRSRMIALLRERGGQLLNEKAVWRTKNGQPIHVLLSYAQVAYAGSGSTTSRRSRGTSIRSRNRGGSFTKSWSIVRPR